jgi:hypothetical protein
MQVINPTALTEAMLLSSTAAENDHAVWAFGSFVVGDKRIMTTGVHKVYQCLVAHTSTDAAGAPNLNTTGTTPTWLELSSTNRWKMFDQEVGSVTLTASPLTVVFKPGAINSLALLELVGRSATVSVKDATGGSVVYTKTKSLDGAILLDWYMYFFEPDAQLTEFTLTDLPSYVYGEVTVTITGTGEVGAGVCTVGQVYALGQAQLGVTTGINDYSVKSTDAFGKTTIVKRKFSKRVDAKLYLDNSALNKVQKLLANLRSTPCVWITSDASDLSLLTTYGFYKDFSLEITYPQSSMCSLSIEGLT